MKTVAFITIHVGQNFGSVLQTIATSEILKSIGVQPVCIDYRPPRVLYKRYWAVKKLSIHFINTIIDFPISGMARYLFRRYLHKQCKMSKPIYASDDFWKSCPKADIYITGSDQVWNFIHNEGYDGHYFFDTIEGVKIAFSSSIGMTELSKEESDILRGKLSTYKAISVREESAKKLLNQLGLSATHLVDPTLVFNKEMWTKYASKRLVKEPYLFVYLPYNITDKDLIYRTIKKVALQHSLKIVSYSYSIRIDKYADKTILYTTPDKFLSLMYYADYIVTNSFHGTAFSINLNKQFWVYMPSKFSTRITSLLDMCALNDRVLDEVITGNQMKNIIDYNSVNVILDEERKKALDFLKTAIN